jgi:hypothetical protein
MPSGSGEVPSWRCFGGLPRAFHLAAADDDADAAIAGRPLPVALRAEIEASGEEPRRRGAPAIPREVRRGRGGAGTETEAPAVVVVASNCQRHRDKGSSFPSRWKLLGRPGVSCGAAWVSQPTHKQDVCRAQGFTQD